MQEQVELGSLITLIENGNATVWQHFQKGPYRGVMVRCAHTLGHIVQQFLNGSPSVTLLGTFYHYTIKKVDVRAIVISDLLYIID